MRRWVDTVAKEIADRGLFRDGEGILVAVSGGVDSMVLLHVLRELAAGPGWRLVAGHFNHQLRGSDADEDERLVEATAGRLGLPFRAGRRDARAFAKANRLSLEMAARTLRHQFLAQTARAEGCPSVALAHHQDDQAELFFLRLLRGTGNEGIAGMKWRNPSPADPSVLLARPLLGQTRAKIALHADRARIPFREDSSNSSLEIPRNRVRKELIPLLETWQPGLRENIARLMEIAGAEADLAGRLAEAWLDGGRESPFETLPVAVQRRCVGLELFRLGLAASFDLVETLRLRPGIRVSTGSGRSVRRQPGGGLEAGPAGPEAFDRESVALSLGEASGRTLFGGVEISWRREPGGFGVFSDGRESGREFFDAEEVGDRVELRHWQPGDRFQPCGMPEGQKLQDLFVNLKVPRAARRRRLVGVVAGGALFWVEGLRVSEKFKVTPGTSVRLEWIWRRDKTPVAGRPAAW